MHATQSAAGGVLDLTSMYLVASFAAAYALLRWYRLPTTAFWVMFGSLVVACELIGLLPSGVPGSVTRATSPSRCCSGWRSCWRCGCGAAVPPGPRLRLGASRAGHDGARLPGDLERRPARVVLTRASWAQAHAVWHLLGAVARVPAVPALRQRAGHASSAVKSTSCQPVAPSGSTSVLHPGLHLAVQVDRADPRAQWPPGATARRQAHCSQVSRWARVAELGRHQSPPSTLPPRPPSIPMCCCHAMPPTPIFARGHGVARRGTSIREPSLIGPSPPSRASVQNAVTGEARHLQVDDPLAWPRRSRRDRAPGSAPGTRARSAAAPRSSPPPASRRGRRSVPPAGCCRSTRRRRSAAPRRPRGSRRPPRAGRSSGSRSTGRCRSGVRRRGWRRS